MQHPTGEHDDELGIQDTSGLSDADWAEINKLEMHTKQAVKKPWRAWPKLTDDPIRTVRVYGAFFPTIKDVMAAEGMTREGLKDMIEKAKSAAH